MTPETISPSDPSLFPAPSVVDLERWLGEDLDDFLHEHNGVMPAPVQCDPTDESCLPEGKDDVQAGVDPEHSPEVTVDSTASVIVSVDPSFFNSKLAQSAITNRTVMRQKLAKHAEERWKQGDKNLRALEGALLKLWLANGHTAELTYADVTAIALTMGQKLTAGEPTSQLKGEPYPAHWRPATMKEILNRAEEPLSWAIDGLLLDNAGHLTSGLPHAGKSLVWLAASIQIVIERKVWGRFRVSSGVDRVLYIETEDPRILIETRVRQLARRLAVSEGELREAGFFLSRPGPFDLVKSKSPLLALVDDAKPDLMVLSTLQGLLGGRDWTAQDDMADVNEFLVGLAEHVPTVVITHSPKDPKLRRSAGTITQEANYATVSHFLKRPIDSGPDKGKDKLNVVVDSKIYPISPFDLLIDSEEAPTEMSPGARNVVGVSLYEPAALGTNGGSESKSAKDDKRARVIAYLAEHPDATIRGIEEAVGVSRELARRIRNETRQAAEDARLFGLESSDGANDVAEE